MNRLPASLLVLLATSAFASAASTASAQQTLPMPQPAPDELGDNEGDSIPVEAQGSIKIFEASNSRYTFDLYGGGIESRSSHEAHWDHNGFQIGIGRSVEAHKSIFFLSGQISLMLRAIDSTSFAFSFTHNTFTSGMLFGPIDIHLRVGTSLLTVDSFHADWSAELLSPHAGAGIGLRVGKLALNLEANSEYLWRWFGASYFIRGISLDFQLEAPRPKTGMQDSSDKNTSLPTVFGLPGLGGPAL